MSAPCCKLARELGKRLAKLDEELRVHGHRSFTKLEAAYGAPKSSIERHKHRCLGIAGKYEPTVTAEPPRDLPPVEVAPKASRGTSQHPKTIPEPSQPDAARARAHEIATAATSHEERVLHIVSQMAAGMWDAPRDISTLSASWGVDRDTVRRMNAEAAVICRVDRGTVEERRQMAMGWWRRVYEEAMLAAAAPGEFDAASKCLAVAAQAQAGWDKAAGVHEDGKTVINIINDPRFQDAARRYVETVQGVLDGAGELADRVRARLGADVPLDVIAAVLAEADAAIMERVSPPQPPALPGGA